MRLVLAGYNIDTQVLHEAEQSGISKQRLTPEILSAAYARISRDSRPIKELRQESLAEVEKARKSNRKIIFEMGHHSVAEHAVFNFDITDISRFAIEELEHFRLCSFTEKSQRYITLDHDFVLPKEVRGTSCENDFCDLVAAQTVIYNDFHKILLKRLEQRYPEKTKKRSGRTLIDGWAKEDARYVTILATSGQLGFTSNARSLELIIKRLNASPIAELKELAKALYTEGTSVAPSILIFTDPSSYETKTPQKMRLLAEQLLSGIEEKNSTQSVEIVDYTKNADNIIASAMMAAASNASMETCQLAVSKMNSEKLTSLFKTVLNNMEFFDSPPREFEHATVTFELIVSAACFAQLKRHRMMSQTVRPYDPKIGLTVPLAIVEAGLEQKFREHANHAETVYYKLKNEIPSVAPYALTNAHQRKVLLTANLRDLYHFIRLREDAHAQWDIRLLAEKMRTKIEEIMPLGSLLLCGKDRFMERYEKVYEKKPKIDPLNPSPVATQIVT